MTGMRGEEKEKKNEEEKSRRDSGGVKELRKEADEETDEEADKGGGRGSRHVVGAVRDVKRGRLLVVEEPRAAK